MNERTKAVLLFIGFTGLILIVGLLEDPSDYEANLKPPAPYEGYYGSQQELDDKLREDPQFRKDYEEAHKEYF